MVMHRIEPARVKPGAVIAKETSGASVGEGAASTVLRGTALIFWDPKSPGKKLDAIDTDQITPAADCVSESLDTLDERWKAGSFRYLMPDFRARVHRGETFVVAGDRFAIGSSREMSPAGIQAIGQECGREVVVVCGRDMGDIFRRNALNLGLHVVQSPEAVEDARDGDEFSFDPGTRELVNETRQRRYQPLPLTPKEDEIRQTADKLGLKWDALIRDSYHLLFERLRTARRWRFRDLTFGDLKNVRVTAADLGVTPGDG